MSFIVAIDGPAGSGKGTVTKIIGEKMKLVTFDTGAMYRAISYYILQKKADINDEESIKNLLEEIDIKLDFSTGSQVLYLNNQKLVNELRTKEVNEIVSNVSQIQAVRTALVKLQRQLAEGMDVIMEGRDIGTVVFPNANVKIYLDASAEERAKRRLKQNEENNISDMTYEEILKSIKNRDEIDSTRAISPLKKADDAIVVDSSNLTINQVTDKIIKIIKEEKKNIKLEKKIYKEWPDSPFKSAGLWIIKHAMLLLLYYPIYRLKVVNKKYVPKDGAYIICANHLNMLDALAVVCSNKRKVRFLCKDSIFKNSIVRAALKTADTIPVNRDKNDIESMKRTIKGLKNGDLLGIFPEGTRKGMEKNVKVKNGAAFFAIKSKVKVIPLGIQGSFKPFTKVKLVYGEPLDFSEYYGKEKDKETLDKVSNIIMDKIVMLTNTDK